MRRAQQANRHSRPHPLSAAALRYATCLHKLVGEDGSPGCSHAARPTRHAPAKPFIRVIANAEADTGLNPGRFRAESQMKRDKSVPDPPGTICA